MFIGKFPNAVVAPVRSINVVQQETYPIIALYLNMCV